MHVDVCSAYAYDTMADPSSPPPPLMTPRPLPCCCKTPQRFLYHPSHSECCNFNMFWHTPQAGVRSQAPSAQSGTAAQADPPQADVGSQELPAHADVGAQAGPHQAPYTPPAGPHVVRALTPSQHHTISLYACTLHNAYLCTRTAQ